MNHKHRVVTAIAVTTALGFTAVACGDDSGGSSSNKIKCESGTPAAQAKLVTDGSKGEGKKVALMFDITGRGDKSFNDSAAAGLDQAKADFGITPEESPPTVADGSDRTERMKTIVDNGNEFVSANGFLWSPDIGKSALANPNVHYTLVDGVAVDDKGTPDAADDTPDLANVRNILFAEHQGSFLVGVAAACASKSGKIGFIGGVNVPSIQKFQAGFQAGVKAVNPDATIDVKYATEPPDFTGFNDPAKGKAIGEAMYASGVDVVYHVAGGTGTGLFEAAKASGKKPGEVYAIGVDSDQYFQVAADIQPYILTSMIKRVDLATYEAIKAHLNGTFKGEIVNYDLKDGIGYAGSNADINKFAGTIDKFKQQIIAGTVVVPDKL